MKYFFFRIFCGFFLGISIFAPGVSGSVMAVMMGVYHRLLDIISNPFKNFKKNVLFLFPLGIGAVLSLAGFILVFSWLFETYEKATYLLFLGLIAGNLPVVFKDAGKGGFKPHYIIGIAAAFGLALTLGIIRAQTPDTANNIMAQNLIYIGISCFVAGVCSMVPGMSISMILMVFGVYNHLMASAKSIDLPVIIVAGISFVIAMVSFSRLTKFIFKRYHGFAYFMVFGFMCGSLVSIYIGLPKDNTNFNWLVGIAALLAGLGISLVFFIMSKKLNLNDGSDDQGETTPSDVNALSEPIES